MAKKSKKAVNKEAPKARKTIKQFLRDLYSKDPNIGNQTVLEKILAAFPTSKATYKTVLTWKKELRDEGINIPKQRAGAKSKDLSKKPTKKTKNAGKKASKKK